MKYLKTFGRSFVQGFTTALPFVLMFWVAVAGLMFLLPSPEHVKPGCFSPLNPKPIASIECLQR